HLEPLPASLFLNFESLPHSLLRRLIRQIQPARLTHELFLMLPVGHILRAPGSQFHVALSGFESHHAEALLVSVIVRRLRFISSLRSLQLVKDLWPVPLTASPEPGNRVGYPLPPR